MANHYNDPVHGDDVRQITGVEQFSEKYRFWKSENTENCGSIDGAKNTRM